MSEKIFYITNGEVPHIYIPKNKMPHINIPTEELKEKKVRWKDDKKAYFKNYHSKNYLCSCGKIVKVCSKSYHLKSLKHKIYELEKKLNG